MPRTAEFYAQAKAAGLCAKCFKVQVDRARGFMCCDSCRRKAVRWAQNRVRRARAEGVCTKCWKRPPAEERLQCVACLSERRSPWRELSGRSRKRGM